MIRLHDSIPAIARKNRRFKAMVDQAAHRTADADYCDVAFMPPIPIAPDLGGIALMAPVDCLKIRFRKAPLWHHALHGECIGYEISCDERDARLIREFMEKHGG